VKRLYYGITAVLLTSAFFTQLLQDNSLLAAWLGWDWKIQFCLELAAGTAATFAGAMKRET